MSTLNTTTTAGRSAAHVWFDEHLADLRRQCRQFVRRLPRHDRDEATAEILARIFQYALRAEPRGKLRLLTPFTMVCFFGRAYCAGRRLTGSSSNDVLSAAAQRRHGLRVWSLADFDALDRRDRPLGMCLSDALPDPKADRPDENARRNLDYPEILEHGRASQQIRRVFDFLVETLGEGRGKDLARELGVGAPRVCQIKANLGRMLAAHGYGPASAQPTNTADQAPPLSPPARLNPIPLNAGTSPSRRDRRPTHRRCLRLPVPNRLRAVHRGGRTRRNDGWPRALK